jgi:hypothetical protein
LYVTDQLSDGLSFDVRDGRVTATCWRDHPVR